MRSRRLLPLALVLLLGSGFAYPKIKGRLQHAHVSETAARQDLANAQADAERLKAYTKAKGESSTPAPVKDAFVELAVFLREAPRVYRVTFQHVNAGGGNVSNQSSRLVAELESSMPEAPSVKKIELTVKGTYRGYEDFRRMLAALREMPVAVRSFSAHDMSFEAVLDVYGV